MRRIGDLPRAPEAGIGVQKKTIHASEQDRPDVAERREGWRAWQPQLDAGRLIFLDETWAKTNMTRLRGRAPRGERLVAKVPHGHWNTTSLIGALGIGGVRCSTVVDGAINRDVFDAFVEQVLAPELRPGDVVILDNLSSHKSEKARQLIELRGARLEFLPPHSPDLNPIEMVFAKIKAAAAIAGLPHEGGAVAGNAVGARPGHAVRRRQLLPPLRLLATRRLKLL